VTLEGDGADGWKFRSFQLEERIDAPYELIVDVTNDDTTADPLALLGQNATLTIERYAPRDIHGIVRRVERGAGGGTDREMHARLTIVPAVWALGRTRKTRIFQEMSVKDILQEVLSNGLSPLQREVSLDLQQTYEPREYCVQWEESDLAFCERLMQEEGIWYVFKHDGDKEVMVLGDTVTSFPVLESQGGGEEVPYSALSQGSGPLEAVLSLVSSRQLVPNKFEVREYDWTRASTEFEGEAALTGSSAASEHEPTMEEYAHGPIVHFSKYAGTAFSGNDAAKQAELWKRRRQVEIERAQARTELTGVTAGMSFTVAGHPVAELDRGWRVAALRSKGAAVGEGGGEVEVEFSNELELVPADTDWRPARTHFKRRVHSVLTATVVGPSGEEIFTDAHGRVKVQFHWDRDGQRDDHSSCFLRSMQPWAGQGWGFVFLPRIGMEVVVSFVDGDIDRPLVIGSVYNSTNTPPYPLPDDKTKSTIKSNSSPGGDGFNELRFEDAAGAEEIFIHAQKDMNETILHNHTRSVGANETISVTGNRTKSVDKNETITITGSQKITISGAQKGDGQTIQGGQLDITGKYKLDASDEILVQAPNKITFTCGGSTIVMEPGKISLTSGGNATVVLDANALMQASGGGKVLLDANANMRANGGGDLLLDANCNMQSSAGSQVLLDAGAKAQASTGGKLELTANAAMEGMQASVTGQTTATVSGAAEAKLDGGGGSVKASPAGVDAVGPMVNVTGSGMVNISGAVVKLN
jgi:type VI secretion system secreted protein VgrG